MECIYQRKSWGWSNIASRALALHPDDWGLVASTPYGPPIPPEVIPELRVRSKHWPPGIWPQIKKFKMFESQRKKNYIPSNLFSLKDLKKYIELSKGACGSDAQSPISESHHPCTTWPSSPPTPTITSVWAARPKHRSIRPAWLAGPNMIPEGWR